MTSRTRAGPRDSKETGRLVLLVPVLPPRTPVVFLPPFGRGVGFREIKEAEVGSWCLYTPQIVVRGWVTGDLEHKASWGRRGLWGVAVQQLFAGTMILDGQTFPWYLILHSACGHTWLQILTLAVTQCVIQAKPQPPQAADNTKGTTGKGAGTPRVSKAV